MLYFCKKKNMDIQTRKIEFIQEFLKIANKNLLEKFENILAMEREKKFNEKIKPMTIKQYEQRIDKAYDDFKNNKVMTVEELKEDIKKWE